MSETEERLQRQVRAMGAVNRQLQAQLEGAVGRTWTPSSGPGNGDLLTSPDVALSGERTASVRRASIASTWLEQLAVSVEGPKPFLVHAKNGRTFLIEGGYRREVRAGLLVAALERMLGRTHTVPDSEFDRWTDGVPVEVLEGAQGPPFVVVGGRRLPLRGLPLPHSVGAEQVQLFPRGPELNLAAANVSRMQFQQAMYGRYQMDRLRAAIARRGVLGTANEVGRRAARRARRVVSRGGR
jgi:hypothetical protein